MPYKLKLKTLTPIHIGRGETIQEFEFHCDSKWYYRLNIDNCFSYIMEKENNVLDKFDEWIQEKESQFEGQGGQQRKKAAFRLNIFDFISKKLKNVNLKNELENKIRNDSSFYHYKMFLNDRPNKDVATCIKTAHKQLYIPGSTLKGMLRTALLDIAIINDEKKNEKLVPILKEGNKNINKEKIENSKKNYCSDFDSHYFNSTYIKEDKNIGQKIKLFDDVKYDIMKFIHITDTNSIPCEEAGILIKPEIYTKKGKQSSLNYYEAINVGFEFNARISVDIEYIKNILNRKTNKDEWLDLQEKFQTLFGDVDFVNEDSIINSIKERVNNFFAGFIEKDLKWSNSSRIQSLTHFYKNIEEDVIKIGTGTGFHGITVMDAMIYDEDEVRDCYVKGLNLLEITKNKKTKNEIPVEQFPTSRRLTELGLIQIRPLGWLSFKLEKE